MVTLQYKIYPFNLWTFSKGIFLKKVLTKFQTEHKRSYDRGKLEMIHIRQTDWDTEHSLHCQVPCRCWTWNFPSAIKFFVFMKLVISLFRSPKVRQKLCITKQKNTTLRKKDILIIASFLHQIIPKFTANKTYKLRPHARACYSFLFFPFKSLHDHSCSFTFSSSSLFFPFNL